MKKIIELLHLMDDNDKNKVYLNEIARLYGEVDELKRIIKELKDNNVN